MNRTPRDWFTFHYRNPSRRNPEPFNNNPGHNPQWDRGLPNGFTSDHKGPTTTRASRVQRSKSNKFTSFQLPRILVESTNRCNKAMARVQVLKSLTLKSHQKQLMLMGGEKRKEKEENHTRTPRSRSTRFPLLRGGMDWWNCRSRSPLTFPQRYAGIMGGIERKASFSKGQQWRRERGKTCSRG